MTVFVALALTLALAVLVLGLAPLLRRGRALGPVLVISALLATAGLYLTIGTPAALDPSVREAPKTLAGAVSRLEAELARDPRQPEGWQLLADGYRAQGRSADAARAYDQALRHGRRTPDLLAQAAEARALASAERRFDATATALLDEALRIDPMHERSRWFLGVAYRQAGRPADAARTWEPLLARVQPSTAAALRPQVDAARREAGLPPLAVPDAPAGLEVRVAIAPSVRARLSPDAVVFVVAREPGQRMPVAVERLAVSALPATVVLGDDDSPMPTRRLSQIRKVEVVARVSRDGTANARDGDPQSPPAASASRGQVTVEIR
ncbi:tetratricopeptide repeat protein [Lysobacter humi (ex Lee et al. 2017)]